MECGPEREALTFSACFTECAGYWVARMSAQALVLVFVPGSPWPPFPVRRDQGDPWAGSTGGSVECARLSCSRTAGFQQSSHVKIIFQQNSIPAAGGGERQADGIAASRICRVYYVFCGAFSYSCLSLRVCACFSEQLQDSLCLLYTLLVLSLFLTTVCPTGLESCGRPRGLASDNSGEQVTNSKRSVVHKDPRG